MAFSNEWDDLYRSNQHMSTWPWSDLVSYVHRYAKPSDGFQRVLELGCGAGANIPFFLKLGVDYHGIDGSPAIIDKLRCSHQELVDRLVVDDFTKNIVFKDGFDLIVDRISVGHNTTQDIKKTLQLIFSKLRVGGKFIGVDWFSDMHMDADRGQQVDQYTRKNLPKDSHLFGTGNVHFSSKEHLTELLESSGFFIDVLEHKQIKTYIPDRAGELAWWNFVVRKP